MALKRQLILIGTDEDGEKVQTTISLDVNPEASYQNLNTGMRMLNNLTTQTYEDTHIVTTTSLNEELAE